MKILVTGANGQLGREMRIVAEELPFEFIFTDVVEAEGLQTRILDITDIARLRTLVREEKVGAIVNCAAYTNVDKAETDEAFCALLNSTAPGNLATVAAETSGLLIHISTDYVFGKEVYNTPCTEDMTGTPTGVYGRTKLEGEKNIKNSGCDYVIIRTAWLYSEFGRNFCKTMLSLTETKPALNVVFDQVGTPTYALDLARVIAVVLKDYEASGAAQGGVAYPKTGIYHYSNEGVCSWFDFTKAIAGYSGHTACRISPCHSDEFPSPVVRPAYSVLDKTKIKKVFGIEVPYWTDSLKLCLDNILKTA